MSTTFELQTHPHTASIGERDYTYITPIPLITEFKATKPIHTDNWNKEDLLEYFVNSWQLNDLLFSTIKNESTYYENPDPLRNPLIFYLGHTAVFYINKLRMVGAIEKPINKHFEKLLELGVDPAKAEDFSTAVQWPSVAEVLEYRLKAFEMVYNIISCTTFDRLPITEESPFWAIMMGLEHDRIHFETSSMLFRQLDPSKLTRPDIWNYAPTDIEAPQNEFIDIPQKTITLGKKRNYPTFGWDNEYGELEVEVKPFRVSKYMITNKEFLEFVEAGGYEAADYWSNEAWQWKEKNDIHHPKFWVPTENGYQYRAMFDVLEMPEAWPVEINHHEASAYCNWKGDGTRLMTEAEWNVITGKHNSLEARHNKENDVMFGQDYSLNIDMYGSPHAVGSIESTKSTYNVYDAFGNVWEWLSDDFYVLPGFQNHHLYRNFTTPFIDTNHSTILGGSWITCGTAASEFYRLWFRRHFYQHAGFRIAQDLT